MKTFIRCVLFTLVVTCASISDTLAVIKIRGGFHMNQENNHLKNAELSTEQNYNMIDGIPNNAPLAPPAPARKRKPLDKVKDQIRQSRSQEHER